MAGRRVKKKPKPRHETLENSYPPWADLSSDLVSLIFQFLQIPDLFSSRAVCRSWSHAEPHGAPPQQIPWLMLSLRPKSASQRFFSVSDRKIHIITLNKNASGAVCCGSFDNWLVLSHSIHGDFLLNPFKNSIINLQFRSCLPQHLLLNYQNDPFLIRKAILSKSPLDKSDELNPCFIAAIYKSQLAVCNMKDGSWCCYGYLSNLEDIIFHGGDLYVIDNEETLCNVEIRNGFLERVVENMVIQSRFSHSYEFDYRKRIYMVTSCINGELLMVLRYLQGQNYALKTCFFKIFELDSKSNPNLSTWKEKEDLTGEALFVSRSGSRAIMASEKFGFEENCIYFLDDLNNSCIHACDDMGVYHMKDGSIEKLMQNRSNSSLSPPSWFFLSNDFNDY